MKDCPLLDRKIAEYLLYFITSRHRLQGMRKEFNDFERKIHNFRDQGCLSFCLRISNARTVAAEAAEREPRKVRP